MTEPPSYNWNELWNKKREPDNWDWEAAWETSAAVPVITDDMAQVDAALALAAAGMYVFPVDHPDLPQCVGPKTLDHNPATCKDRGKHPAVAFSTAADTNPKMIHMWWAGGPRNIGINCGKSDLVVIDEDRLGAFKQFADEHGHKITPTLVVTTAKGRHYYFVAPADTQLGNKAGALKDYNIDVRAGNAYVVGPGSIHATGAVYRIEVPLPPAPLPTWVVQAIKAKTNSHKDDGVWETVGEDFNRFELPAVIKDGTRDDTLFKYASSLLARELPRGEAEILMRSAWERCEQPPKAKDTYPLDKALAKLDRYEPGRSEGYEKQDTSGGNRPPFKIHNDALAADWLREELGRNRLAGIFRRDDQLVHTPRIGEEGYLPAQDLGLVDAGPAQVRPITTTGIKSLIETRYQLWRTTTVREGTESKKIKVEALFPQQSAQSACEAARLGEHAPHLRTLHGVTHTPMMRRDGTILDQPGYDTATGFLYLPDPDLVVPPIPDSPASEKIKAAVGLILTPIAEFPFVSEDDRATWIGMVFTPALRPLLPGPYQMGVITATNPGSGKTKLATMIRTIHGGVQRGELPRDADELRKSITAALMDTTAPVIAFDNLTGVIRSSVLEALLTSRTWTDRWLGQNRSVTATNDRLWLATGNNAQFGGDLARRIATVALDPPEANHHLRTDFTIKDLDAWMWEHRGRLLAAILTIARGWVVAGRPSVAVRSDDYAPWVGGLRSMLGWAGFPGTFGGSSTEVAVSSDDEEWHAFLVALHDAFDAEPFTVKELVERLDSFTSRIDAAALPGDLAQQWSHIRDGKDTGFRKSLGWWLKNRAGRYAVGWSLVAAGADGHSKAPRYVKPPTDPNLRGLRGFRGFDPATREKENSHLVITAGENGREKTLETPQTPQTDYDFAKAMSDTPTCWRCSKELIWTDEQRSVVCSQCDPEANLWREEDATEADVADLQPVDVNPQSTPEDMMMSEISGENKDFEEFDPDEPPPLHIGDGSGSNQRERLVKCAQQVILTRTSLS